MHIVDAIRALKGEPQKLRQDLEAEKEAHLLTMSERDEARETLQPCKDALAAAQLQAEDAQRELAAVAQELGVEYPAVEEAPAKGK